jgi:hypothetical protein
VSRERVEQHWAGVLAGAELGPDEERELLAAIEADPGLREELLRDLDTDGLLRAAGLDAADGAPLARAFREHLANERDADAFIGKTRARFRRERRRPAVAAAAAAALILAACGLALVLARRPDPGTAPAGRVRDFAPPREWSAADGNPAAGTGGARWRLDEVWPDDPLQTANYRPLEWDGRKWYAARHALGHRPGAERREEGLRLSARTWWPQHPGSKLAALVFVAPADGAYRIDGAVTLRVWEGGSPQPVGLDVLRADRAAGSVERLLTIRLKDGETAGFGGLPTELQSGQELIWVPAFPALGHVAAHYDFQDLKLVRVEDSP